MNKIFTQALVGAIGLMSFASCKDKDKAGDLPMTLVDIEASGGQLHVTALDVHNRPVEFHWKMVGKDANHYDSPLKEKSGYLVQLHTNIVDSTVEDNLPLFVEVREFDSDEGEHEAMFEINADDTTAQRQAAQVFATPGCKAPSALYIKK